MLKTVEEAASDIMSRMVNDPNDSIGTLTGRIEELESLLQTTNSNWARTTDRAEAAENVRHQLERHISELEKSLENARKERDAELALRGEAEEARDYAVREAVKANAEAAQAIRDRDYWQKEAKAAADVAVIERNIRLTTERERDAALADNADETCEDCFGS
jgi:chromosome segregation ATPase